MSQILLETMNYCPICKSGELQFDGIKKFYCPECSWEYYHNTAAAVAGIIEYKEKVLVVERNLNPGKGMLDFPGGFVEPHESAESALKREMMEELGVEIFDLIYLCSTPNIYKYKGIEYATCDFFFKAKIETDLFKINNSEIASIRWVSKINLAPELFAFVSMQKAIEIYSRV